MNLRRLEQFVTLAQIGNLRRASELLHVSPPALSKAIRVLEEELELELFAREGRSMHLTDTGKLLLRRAPALLDSLRTLKEQLQPNSERSAPLRVGTFEVFSTYFLGFLKEPPWTEAGLELHELLPGELERYVREGELDLGITYMPVPDGELDFLKVTSIEMGVFTRVGAFKGVPQPELPFVVPVLPLQGVPTRVRGLDGWPEDAYQRRVLHRVTLMESALELCRQGQVAGYFPSFVVHEHNRRVIPALRLERRRSPYPARVCRADVFLVKRRSTQESPYARKLAKALRLAAKN